MTSIQSPEYVVAIGASAGGLDPLREIMRIFPANLNAPIVIAMHSAPGSQLTEILNFGNSLSIVRLEDEQVLECGHIYVVPGAHHAFFKDGRISLSAVVDRSRYRPSIDALFTTLALEYREKAIAVVLSGQLDDGKRGAQIIYDLGGTTIVQCPEDAEFSSMPMSVIAFDHPETAVPAAELAHWLIDKIGTA